MIAMYAGIASVRLSSSNLISTTELTIKNPTIMSAGAVAKEGIEVKSGANRVESRKSTPVTSAVRPVRPPTETPDADSTKVVTVDVPRTAPAEVPIASERSAGRIPGSLPSLSSILALVATPISVPRVSKRSTNRNAKTTTINSVILIAPKSTLKHWPKVSPSLEKSAETKLVGIRE